jgi:GR25 family glycosyltransferase involved in LPS biosynthesis
MKLTDYFDKTFCINLDRRNDRWEKSVIEFEKHHLIVDRFSAKDGKEINLPYPFGSELGGAISHLNVIKKAKELNLENVLILEDDVEFVPDLNDRLEKIMTKVPTDWDMIYFGGNHVGGYLPVNDYFFKIFKSYAIQCYAVNSKCFGLIINYLENKINQVLNGTLNPKPSVAADYFIADLHPSLNCYVIRPHVCWQKEDFSDIQESVVNYDFLKK